MKDQKLDPILRRSFGIEVKAKTTRSIHVIASTSAIDSYGDIVEQDWVLERYRKNPVVLWNHNRSGGFLDGPSAEEMLPIGKATDVAVRGGRLEATIVFVDEKASPLAERVYQGFIQGSINAVSVGFRPGTVKAEKINGREVYRLSQNELYEISATPIPANPDAVVRSAALAQLRALASRALPIGGAKSKPCTNEDHFECEGKSHCYREEIKNMPITKPAPSEPPVTNASIVELAKRDPVAAAEKLRSLSIDDAKRLTSERGQDLAAAIFNPKPTPPEAA
jgi:hypothetical protein